MAVITPEIKEFIKNNLGWITTVSKDGELDLGPKMSLFVLDDTHIAYHERTAGQHYENLKNGSPLVIAFANLEKKQGYRFRGNVVLHVDDDIYNEQVKVGLRTFSWRLSERFLVCSVLRSVRGRWSYTSQRR